MTEKEEGFSKDFIRRIIEADLQQGHNEGKVVTRFPPEPNGFLHIGHAKSICLNFGIAQENQSVCHLRFDDTDPTKEDVIYENSIQEDIHWLGFDWQGKLFHASDYFEKMYQYAVQLIKDGKAYVCALNEEQIREYRGTVTCPGKISPHASRSVEENLSLFTKMRAGEFPDSAYVLRARIDMASPNMKMRDPLLYRIRHAHHYMTGDKWCLYPMYDYAHPLSDAIEGITHSICTLEFENNRELYDWVLDNVKADFPTRPRQYEFARLDLNDTVMSKRKLLQLVEKKAVSGWDDPRLPTISGLRRRGCTPEAIKKFCELVGIAKSNSTVEPAMLEFCLRDHLNTLAPRVMAVLHPVKVVIDNYPTDKIEYLNASYWPHDIPKQGFRQIPFSRELFIEQEDFMESPGKDFYRLAPGQEVRLRYSYCITCKSIEKDPSTGKVTVIHCDYDPQTLGKAPAGRKVKGTIHWVPLEAVKAEVRLYEPLLLCGSKNTEGDFLEQINPSSLTVIRECLIEPTLAAAKAGERFQFERQGYFFVDPLDSRPGCPVFNRIVSLKDSWTKKTAVEPEKIELVSPKKAADQSKNNSPLPSMHMPDPHLTIEQKVLIQRYCQSYKINEEDARIIVQNQEVAKFFESALKEYPHAQSIVNWINNELLRELKNRTVSLLPFSPAEFATLVRLIDEGVVSGKSAKEVFALMLKNGGNPADIIAQYGLEQINDPVQLGALVDELLAANADSVNAYQNGNERLFGFFVGLAMKKCQGRANAELINQLLMAKLK